MREITDLHELQQIELDMLREIDKICRRENIRYFLAGGTLLGAVRHKGFIPWDDDIDISMSRDEYERFLRVMKKENHPYYKVLATEFMEGFPETFAKVVDTRTRLVEEIGKDLPDRGVCIDVFPIDGMGDDRKKAMKRLMKIIRIRSRIWEAGLKEDEIKNKELSLKNKIVKETANALIRMIGVRRSYFMLLRYAKKKDFHTSYWIASAVGGAGIERELVEQKCFADVIEMEFEGEKFFAPVGYDRYLSCLYGDYMKLPPKEQQVASHRGKVWWK